MPFCQRQKLPSGVFRQKQRVCFRRQRIRGKAGALGQLFRTEHVEALRHNHRFRTKVLPLCDFHCKVEVLPGVFGAVFQIDPVFCNAQPKQRVLFCQGFRAGLVLPLPAGHGAAYLWVFTEIRIRRVDTVCQGHAHAFRAVDLRAQHDDVFTGGRCLQAGRKHTAREIPGPAKPQRITENHHAREKFLPLASSGKAFSIPQ